MSGALLAVAVAWYARGHVVRPVRIFGALAVFGVAAALLGLGGAAVPRAVLAAAAALALAFSVNGRRLRRPRRPALVRGAWIAAAALMLAALPGNVIGAGAGGIGAVSVGLFSVDLIAILLVGIGILFAVVRIARGILSDRGDRLLVGALAGVVLFGVLWSAELPWPAAVWSYPFWLLLGAADARAYGNIRRP